MGTSLLWTSVVTWPLMAAVQMMCARIGMVTGEGLASGLRKKMPRWVCIVFVVALLVANTINVGADLAGMADAAELLTGWNSHLFVVVFGIVIAVVTVKFRYHQIAQRPEVAGPQPGGLCPRRPSSARPEWAACSTTRSCRRWPADRDAWGMIVAILGTTISPYLFFWQAAQEVEEEKAKGRRMLVKRYGATTERDREPPDRRGARDLLLQRRDVLRHPLLRDARCTSTASPRSPRRRRRPRRCAPRRGTSRPFSTPWA